MFFPFGKTKKEKNTEKVPEKPGTQYTRPIPPLTGVDAQADIQAVLEGIVRDVVKVLGYIGASMAVYETGDALSMRSTYVDRNLLPKTQFQHWEKQLRNIALENTEEFQTSKLARVYVHDPIYKNNLGVRAAKAGFILTSSKLYDLFQPIIPRERSDIIEGLQEKLGIKQVISIPFFLNAIGNNIYEREYVGNLFVVSERPLSRKDKDILIAFTRHLALTILSEQRYAHIQLTQKLVLNTHRYFTDEQKVIDTIAKGIVIEMGYAGAMVATYEEGGALPAKAIYIDSALVSMEDIQEWERKVSSFLPRNRSISLFDPTVARVYLGDSRYKDNLGFRSATTGDPILSDEIFDLFRPIAPKITQSLILKYQKRLGIRQVISVPFFLDEEFVGNLFVATKSMKFTSWEIETLRTFGHQAAAGLRNARLYNQAKDRQAATEVLGRMAFSAAATVHTFRNHIGLIRGSLQVLNNMDSLSGDDAKQRDIFDKMVPPVIRRLDDVALLLDGLQSPRALRSSRWVDVNFCLDQALSKVGYSSEKWVELSLDEKLPEIRASQEILIEVFRGIIKNATEALAEKGAKRFLRIESRFNGKQVIEVNIKDNGIGIKPENLSKVFEIFESTKPLNLGLGLFWSRDYIEGLGGTIKIKSVWKEGSVCFIRIPVKEENKTRD